MPRHTPYRANQNLSIVFCKTLKYAGHAPAENHLQGCQHPTTALTSISPCFHHYAVPENAGPLDVSDELDGSEESNRADDFNDSDEEMGNLLLQATQLEELKARQRRLDARNRSISSQVQGFYYPLRYDTTPKMSMTDSLIEHSSGTARNK